MDAGDAAVSITGFKGAVEEPHADRVENTIAAGAPNRRSNGDRLTPKGADRDTIPHVQQVVDPNREPPPDVGAKNRPVSLPRRLAALFVLIALLASAAISSWWILSNQADFFAAGGRREPATADEAHP